MGWCKPPGKKWSAGWTQQKCNEEGGVYSSEQPKPEGGGCFVTTILTPSLGQSILDLGKTYQAQVDFRDKILQSSPTGRRMVKLYYQINPTMLKIVMGNATLLGESIQAWSGTYRFVQSIIDADAANGRPSGATGRVRFSKAGYKEFARLFDKFRAESKGNRKFQAAVNEIEREIQSYAGMTAKEALARIRRRSAGGGRKAGAAKR